MPEATAGPVPAHVPPERVFLAGYGAFRPNDNGTTDEAKRRNRRVEILVMR